MNTSEQDQIARNLARLIETHGLKESRAVIPPMLWDLSEKPGDLDHARLYHAPSGAVVLIMSNYDLPPPACLAMEPHEPLYSLRCKSFIRMFTSLAAMRAAIRDAAAHGRKGRL